MASVLMVTSWILYPVKSGFCQYQEISFKHLSTVDGLSNFTVLSVAQDKQGFMWFGTMDGLNRFDGQQIKIYRSDADEPYTIGNNLIYSLLCTSDSGMWVGTSHGLFHYEFAHDDFYAVPIIDQTGKENTHLEVKSMIVDNTFLWIGTSEGLYRYDLEKEIFSFYSTAKVDNSILNETVEVIYRSENGTIWVGGEEGLCYIQDGTLNRVPSNPNINYSGSSNVISIVSDADGKIWFGTVDLEAGLLIYDPDSGIITDLNADQGYIPHNKVNCLHKFEDGKIWAGTTWGLAIIDQETYQSQHLLYERRNPGSISQNSIKAIFQGDSGIIWIGTYSGGVNYFDQRSRLIRHETNIYENEYSLNFNIVSSIFQDRTGDLWLGTEYGGVNILNSKDQTYRILRKGKNGDGLISDNIKSIVEDQYGKKFIATQFGLSIYDPTSMSFFNIDNSQGPRGKLNSNVVHDLCLDQNGNVWIGAHKWIGTSKVPGPGYFLMYDVNKDTVIHYYSKDSKLGVVAGGVNTIIHDPQRDIIWSGGDNGITCFDKVKKEYMTDTLFMEAIKVFEGTVINDIYLAANNLLWIATFGKGLFMMDVESYKIREVSRQEGLHERSFYAITSDNNGDIWTSVSAHLLKIISPATIEVPVVKIEKYGIQEGFPPQQYFRTAACRGANGTLYFGGDDGFISFNPDEVENNIFYPEVAILDVLVNGESLELAADVEGQDWNIGALKTIPLTHDQSSFAIQFIGHNFINPENTWYQYQISNIHDSWQELGNSSTINFTELKAGDYELKIRASSDPDSFIDNYTYIFLHVSPPYWATPLAYLIYLAIILVSLYLLFRISRKWERLNQNLKFEYLQREQEKEFNQKRIKFFTDISHELRTPLTLILAPLERIVKSNFGNAKVKNQLMLMLRNGDRMLQLINQLLDLRKLETGHVHLQVAKGNIVRFIKETSLSFRELANDHEIQFNVEAAKEHILVWFDRNKFEIILFNLLSNAVKYTPKNGRVRIAVTEANAPIGKNVEKQGHDEMVHIMIENTGQGIPEDQIEHIFERFYTGEKDALRSNSSSGVGLEIVKNLVELHGGNIFAESTFDKNGISGVTQFTIALKCGKEHFSADEIIKDFKSSEDISNYESVAVSMRIDEKIPEISDEQDVNEGAKSEYVLIVEDNAEVRKLVANLFSNDYQVYEAANGREGLSISREKIPDLVISDIMMPEMDGIQLCRELKTDINTSHIPVILLTARTAVTFRYEGLETGADDYIVKPFNVEDLRLRAKNLISQRKKLKDRFSRSGLIIPTEVSLTSVDEKLMQKTIDYVMENIGKMDLSVEKIASEVGMSRTNFYRKIKALTNGSASEFIRSIRMNYAAQLLKTNKVRVSEVGPMVGITDVDYFRDCFKKQFGVSPKVYIESEGKAPDLTQND